MSSENVRVVSDVLNMLSERQHCENRVNQSQRSKGNVATRTLNPLSSTGPKPHNLPPAGKTICRTFLLLKKKKKAKASCEAE